MKRIAILHPAFAPGGAAAVAMWTVQALKTDYEIELITTEKVDLNECNAFFGTTIGSAEVRVVRVPPILPWDLDGILLKIASAERYYKRGGGQADLAIATACEMDLGGPGIQYVHCPMWDDRVLRELGQLPRGWLYREGPLRWAYKRLAMHLGRYRREGMRKNLTLVNSDWMGLRVAETCGVETMTVYPPVNDDFPKVDWEDREDGFVCLGAVTPGKGVERAIRVVAAVRRKYPEIHLHIIGTPGSPKYAREIEASCSANAAWLTWEKSLPRKELVGFVSRHRYGIHGMPNEHFGIAVAEMVKAGCIPFVPDSGGPVEIVADPRLLYGGGEEAVRKIEAVLSDKSLQGELRSHLQEQGRRFSVSVFSESLRRVVAETLARQ